MITAVLKNATILDVGELKIARGAIFGDVARRFEDGEFIRTSAIVEGPDADGVIKTRNSTYKLEMADV